MTRKDPLLHFLALPARWSRDVVPALGSHHMGHSHHSQKCRTSSKRGDLRFNSSRGEPPPSKPVPIVHLLPAEFNLSKPSSSQHHGWRKMLSTCSTFTKPISLRCASFAARTLLSTPACHTINTSSRGRNTVRSLRHVATPWTAENHPINVERHHPSTLRHCKPCLASQYCSL